ncbi:hypothetical protein Bhyg_03755 [Pseudolycoriella hygida]|uniref:C2H2-type domain-containing protein n=1 Tax=Pseudolycoriella hygida TaxID=35572 RepID=A0A9Q0NDW2_9DIPT|nr:hypothetical protein Bhyg_03755 [Pseudolycoriella hygida]
MDNYSNNYLINSFGHEFNENFAESYDQHDQHQSKTDYEIPLQSSIFGYDEMGTTHQDANIWNDDQSGYMVYQNYFENQNLTDISDSTNIANSMQLYPNESIEFISNRSSDFENPVMLPFIDNIEAIETPSERSSTQFCCNETNCNKTYASLSGLNNHIKKKHSVTAATASFHCDECNATFMTPQQRTVHKIKEHNGRKCQVAKQKNCIKDTEKNV